jgi:lipopolysaccharide export system permease protein
MPRVIAAALNREVLSHWIAILLILWFVLLSARFSLYLAEAVTGQLPASAVLMLAGLKSIGFAVFVMPLALFIALLMVLGRWNRDRESVALAASGLGTSGYLRLLWPTLLLVTVLVFILTLFVVPETTRYGYQLRHQVSEAAVSKLWAAGRFVSLRNGELLLFADSLSEDGNILNNVFVQSSRDKKQILLSAQQAVRHTDEESGDRFIVLQQGYRYDGLPGTVNYRVLKFDQYGVRIDSPGVAVAFKWDAVASHTLFQSSEPAANAELQERLSRPLSVVILVIAGTWLGRFIPGRGRYAGLFAGVLIFILYFNLLGVARTWVAKEESFAGIGLWWVHLVPLASVWLVDKWQQRNWFWK